MNVRTAEQSWQGALLVSHNARVLLEAGKSLASSGRCGAGVALCILSLEESTKAYVLLGEAVGFQELPQPVEKYFRNHKSKHETGMVVYLCVRLLFYATGIAKYMSKTKEEGDHMGRLKRKLENDVEHFVKNETDYVGRLYSWVENADRNKQRGLYVDMVDGVWISPGSIENSEFQRHRRMARDLVIVLERLFKESDLITLRKAYQESVSVRTANNLLQGPQP